MSLFRHVRMSFLVAEGLFSCPQGAVAVCMIQRLTLLLMPRSKALPVCNNSLGMRLIKPLALAPT
jgi:hypothetical protein